MVGGLICGLAKTKKSKEEEVPEITQAEQPMDVINQEMLDVEIEGEEAGQEDDEITFVGETESAFFNYLKRG